MRRPTYLKIPTAAEKLGCSEEEIINDILYYKRPAFIRPGASGFTTSETKNIEGILVPNIVIDEENDNEEINRQKQELLDKNIAGQPIVLTHHWQLPQHTAVQVIQLHSYPLDYLIATPEYLDLNGFKENPLVDYWHYGMKYKHMHADVVLEDLYVTDQPLTSTTSNFSGQNLSRTEEPEKSERAKAVQSAAEKLAKYLIKKGNRRPDKDDVIPQIRAQHPEFNDLSDGSLKKYMNVTWNPNKPGPKEKR